VPIKSCTDQTAVFLDHETTAGIRQQRQRPRRIGVTKRQALVSDYQAGATINQVADRHGVARGTVMQALRVEGVEARRFRFDDETIQTVIDLRRQGLSLRTIAEQLGVDRHALSRNLKRLGHADQAAHRQAASDQQLAEAVRLYQTGLSMAVVGQQVGMTPGAVQRTLLKAHVPTRDSQGRGR
jgi:transposase-like protein